MQEYKAPILLSVPGGEAGTVATIREIVERFRDDSAPRPSRIILHAPAVIAATDTVRERRSHASFLARAIADGFLSIWSAGYAGGAHDLLTDEELLAERRWGESNRWKHGLRDVLGTSGVRFFPIRVRRDQVATIQAENTPLCLGYRAAPIPGRTGSLVLWDGPDPISGWSLLPSIFVPLGVHGVDPATFGRRTGQTDSPALVHVVLPRGPLGNGVATAVTEIVEAVSESIGTGDPELVATSPLDDPRGTAFFAGYRTPYPIERESTVLACLSVLRVAARDGRTEEDTLRSILCTSADLQIHGRRVVTRKDPGDEASEPLRSPSDRELQGGSSGFLTMREGELRARFIGGRICGVWVTEEPGITSPETSALAGTSSSGDTANRSSARELRAQGFLRRGTGSGTEVEYLESAFSAWFTGTVTRGIHEHAILPGGITLTNEAVMIEGYPALLYSHTVAIPPLPPPDAREIVLFEIPICTVPGSLHPRVAHLAGEGAVYRITLEETDGGPPEHDSTELYFTARHVIVDLPSGGSVRITPAEESGKLHIPFRFGIVPRHSRATLVLRPHPRIAINGTGAVGTGTTTATALPEASPWPEPRRWSSSFIFSAEATPAEALSIGPDLTAEIPGFTADFPDEVTAG